MTLYQSVLGRFGNYKLLNSSEVLILGILFELKENESSKFLNRNMRKEKIIVGRLLPVSVSRSHYLILSLHPFSQLLMDLLEVDIKLVLSKYDTILVREVPCLWLSMSEKYSFRDGERKLGRVGSHLNPEMIVQPLHLTIYVTVHRCFLNLI